MRFDLSNPLGAVAAVTCLTAAVAQEQRIVVGELDGRNECRTMRGCPVEFTPRRIRGHFMITVVFADGISRTFTGVLTLDIDTPNLQLVHPHTTRETHP
ncbi:hypothetical protein ACWEN6_13905 [Sphaerisporangium sp. NPDC004334]